MHAVFELGRPAIRRIVFMGMGEPLLNVENILRAIEIFTLPSGLGFSPSRITVSSSGVVPGIVELSKKAPGVGLAVSLNAPDHERRAKVMSIAKKYPLKDLFEALRAWTRTTKAPVTLEYVLLPGFNMALEDAPKLASLVRGLPCKINLIPFNPFPGSSFRPPSDDEVDAFANRLHAKGLRVQIRRSRGLGALAACGQLGAGLLAGPRRLKALSR
jgi:23S rRNA (adenine2503-C2)-methyltransferase